MIVFVASLLNDILLASAIGSGSMSDMLVHISENLTLMRISNLVTLTIQSTGIIALAVLLYVVLSKQNKILALVALGWWLAEAITLAVSRLEAYALIPLSQEFVKAGTPQPSYFQTLGEFLYHGVNNQGYDIHMLFFCLGRDHVVLPVLQVRVRSTDTVCLWPGNSLSMAWQQSVCCR